GRCFHARASMTTLDTLPVGFTMGDAAGIGPEIIVKLFAAGLPQAALVYGDAGILDATIIQLGLADTLKVEIVSGPEQVRGLAGVMPVLNRWRELPSDLPSGQISALAGRGAYEYL